MKRRQLLIAGFLNKVVSLVEAQRADEIDQ